MHSHMSVVIGLLGLPFSRSSSKAAPFAAVQGEPMCVTIRPFVMALSIALMAALSFAALSQKVLAQQAASPEEGLKQDALTDQQIDAFLAAQKDVEAIVAKAPEGDGPDPKVMEQLEAVAKKYKFANYAEYDDVAGNIGLVMSGIDPDTKKYVGAEAVIKKEIASVEGDKSLRPDDKQVQLEQLRAELKSPPEPVKIPANIELVTKNYDKLTAAMPQNQ
jgi:hypothetical protein